MLDNNAALQRVIEHETKLETLLECFHPEKFIPRLNKEYILAKANGKQASFPPHILVAITEAACAYWKQWKYKPFEYRDIVRVINHCLQFQDPFLESVITPDSDLMEFELYVFRQQLEKQSSLSWLPAGRVAKVFGSSQSSHFGNCFKKHTGVSVEDWLKMSFIVWASTSECGFFNHAYAARIGGDVNIKQSEIDAFLCKISQPIETLAAEYRRLRNEHLEHKPHWRKWLCKRSCFQSTPLLHLNAGYYAPCHGYVTDLLTREAIRITRRMNDSEASNELGERYHEYVVDIARVCLPTSVIHTASKLESVTTGKSCDIVIEFKDCLLLIECKATFLDRDVLTKDVWFQSGTAAELVRAWSQCAQTAARIRDGGYVPQGLIGGKPIYAIVACFGEVVGANHPTTQAWLLEQLRSTGADMSALKENPEVLYGSAIEYLLILLGQTANTVPAIFKERAAYSYKSIGEWNHFLSDRVGEVSDEVHAFWNGPIEQLLSDLGVGASARIQLTRHTPSSDNPAASARS